MKSGKSQHMTGSGCAVSSFQFESVRPYPPPKEPMQPQEYLLSAPRNDKSQQFVPETSKHAEPMSFHHTAKAGAIVRQMRQQFHQCPVFPNIARNQNRKNPHPTQASALENKNKYGHHIARPERNRVSSKA